MTTPNGELPPAPPTHTPEDRLTRLEQLAVQADQGRLWREVQALRAELAVLANQVYVLKDGRDGVYDSLHEVALSVIRQQRVIDRLESQIQALLAPEGS